MAEEKRGTSGKEISMVEGNKNATGADEATAQQGTPAKIIWDDSAMRSVYSNATNVAGGREEIVLLFGMNQSWHAGQKDIKVQLSDRIILSPYAAKRLSILLNNVLRDYEKRFGALDMGA
jgi:hypothetical protein